MGDRCLGHCCQKFYLPMAPDRLWTMYDQWVKSGKGSVEWGNDIHIIAPMVTYLGYIKDPTDPDNLRFGHYYTCKHHDKESGNCGIYERRPKLCSEYPYANTCTFKHCQWDDGKAGLYPPHLANDKALEHLDRNDPRYGVFMKHLANHEASSLGEVSKTPPSDDEILQTLNRAPDDNEDWGTHHPKCPGLVGGCTGCH